MGKELRLRISENGADAERLVTLAGYVRANLLQLDVVDVRMLASGDRPSGARGGGLTVAGGLLVALGQTAESLSAVVSAIRDWLRCGSTAPRKVRLELDGDVLELGQASTSDQERLIGLFIALHAGGDQGDQWVASV
jgi:hypothetical protein